jgi:heme/copper-type cytochrome/quinol oxidase subunit 2
MVLAVFVAIIAVMGYALVRVRRERKTRETGTAGVQ